MTKGKLIHVQVGDGGFIPAYLHRLKMSLDDYTFPVMIGFSYKLGVEFNLLGRSGIFDRFDVTFSQSRGTITLVPPKL